MPDDVGSVMIHIKPSWKKTVLWLTDRQTDRQTDRLWP